MRLRKCNGYRRSLANCRHTFHPFIEGVSERTYTDAELEDMKPENHTFRFDGKEYDQYSASQMQRRIERTIRKVKRERDAYKAAGLKEDAQSASIRLHRLNTKYREFSEAAGLPEQPERMRVLYQEDIKPLADVEKSVTIEEKRSELLSSEQTIEAAKTLALSRDYDDVGTFQELRAITNKKLGYDGLPTVVNGTEFEKIASGKTRLFRGVAPNGEKTAEEIVSEFKFGNLWTGNSGGAVYGSGVYFTETRETAQSYAGDEGALIEAILSDGARIADYKTIYQEYLETGIPKIFAEREEFQQILGDVGQYAAVKGYDAIALNGFQGHDYVVLLNRRTAIVKE